MKLSDKCLICHSNVKLFIELNDDRYGYPDYFSLLECQSCGHKYLRDAPDASALSDLYSNFYPRKSFNPDNFIPYREGTKFYSWFVGGGANACESVPSGKRVLDIGCGLGQTVAYLKSKGCDAHGIDADRNVELIAQKYHLNIRIGIFDANLYEIESFDYVLMNQVIEHLPNLNSGLEMVHRVLNHKGRCVLTTPNANGWGSRLFGKKWLNWHAPYHQQFLSKDSLYLLAEKHGFLVEKIQTITRSEWIMYQILHLMNYPKPGEPSAFWAPYATKRSFIKKWLQRGVVLSWFIGIPQLITRLFDSLGVGDNYLIILKKK